MNAQILPFPKPPAVSVSSPVALFLRVGEAHRKLADLHATGHLPARRAVFDASRVRHQRDLIAALRLARPGLPAALITAERARTVARRAVRMEVLLLAKPMAPEALLAFLAEAGAEAGAEAAAASVLEVEA